jgi:hypothetical protein
MNAAGRAAIGASMLKERRIVTRAIINEMAMLREGGMMNESGIKLKCSKASSDDHLI